MDKKKIAAWLAEQKKEERRIWFMRQYVSQILEEQKLPKIVDLAIECSPAFKSEKIQKRIGQALKVLAVTCEPRKLRDALLSSKETRKRMFGSEWELPVFVAEGIVLDLLDERNVFNPKADDLRNSKLFYNTVLTYIPEGMSMGEFEKVKHGWVEKLIAIHPEFL